MTEFPSTVFVFNYGPEFRLKYDRQDYVFPAGTPSGPSRKLIPWEAAKLFFGDPTLQDLDEHDMNLRFRTDEVNRLGMLYATFFDPWYSSTERSTTPERKTPTEELPAKPYVPVSGLGYKPARDFRFRHPGLPRVEVYNPETDERIFMVIDDPFGENVLTPEESSDLNTEAMISAQVARLVEAELERIRASGVLASAASSTPASVSPPRPTSATSLEDVDGVAISEAFNQAADDIDTSSLPPPPRKGRR